MRTPIATSIFWTLFLITLPFTKAQDVQVTTSFTTGVHVITTGGSVVSVPTTVAFTLTVTGGASQTGSVSTSQTGSSNRTTIRTTSTPSTAPVAATDIPLGGGNGAPSPGGGRNDINGPNDDFIAGASMLHPVIATTVIALLAGVGLLAI